MPSRPLLGVGQGRAGCALVEGDALVRGHGFDGAGRGGSLAELAPGVSGAEVEPMRPSLLLSTM